jgi:hypothetical protein
VKHGDHDQPFRLSDKEHTIRKSLHSNRPDLTMHAPMTLWLLERPRE